MGYHRKRRETEGQEEKGKGREDAVLYEKGGYKPDRWRICRDYRRKVLPPELTNTIEQFIVYVHRNETHFTYIYVYHTNVFEAGSIYKKSPPDGISHICFCYLLPLWGSTHDSADCCSAHSHPAARDCFKRVRH